MCKTSRLYIIQSCVHFLQLFTSAPSAHSYTLHCGISTQLYNWVKNTQQERQTLKIMWLNRVQLYNWLMNTKPHSWSQRLDQGRNNIYFMLESAPGIPMIRFNAIGQFCWTNLWPVQRIHLLYSLNFFHIITNWTSEWKNIGCFLLHPNTLQ